MFAASRLPPGVPWYLHMLRHVEVPWAGARCCAVVTPLSPSHAAACGSALGGESHGQFAESPLWHSVNCVWRTLAFQVATGRWCGPPRAAHPMPRNTSDLRGMWWVPFLRGLINPMIGLELTPARSTSPDEDAVVPLTVTPVPLPKLLVGPACIWLVML